MLEKLQKLKELKGKFATGSELSAFILSNDEVTKEIQSLYTYFFGRIISGCKNCIFDAFIQLFYLDMETAKEKNECLFEMKRGALCLDNDKTKNMTQANITNELALYHLRKNPNEKRKFTKLPENIEELLKGSEVNESKTETGALNGQKTNIVKQAKKTSKQSLRKPALTVK